MSHNAYLGGRDGTTTTWPLGGVVSPADYAWIAAGVFKSLNGDDGGTWAPANAIIIGGAGVQFTTVATQFYGIVCNGDLYVLGSCVLEHNGQVGTTSSDTWTFDATLAIRGPVGFSGGSSGTHQLVTSGGYVDWTFSGRVNLYGGNTYVGQNGSENFIVAAWAGFTNSVVLSGGTSGTHVTFSTAQYVDLVHNGHEEHNGTEVHNGAEGHYGACSFLEKVTLACPVGFDYIELTSGGTISASSAFVETNIGADATFTLSTGEATGQKLEVTNPSAHAATISGPGGGAITIIPAAGWADFIWTGIVWKAWRKSY